MDLASLLFYILGALSVLGAICVITVPNPIFCALFLALTMVSLSGIFFSLGAYFVAGVQLIVYAGAVTVLFVMVVMLFDLKKETQAFSAKPIGFLLRTVAVGAFMGLLWGGVELARGYIYSPSVLNPDTATRSVSELLFTKYIFAFEIISVLLLLVVIGSVTLARSKGGTHA